MAQKELLPLVLSVKAQNWRMYDDDSASADEEFRQVRLKALERDDRTCVFCAFRAPKWQEVHHRNDDHSDNSPQNLVTACMFCHMCQHIGLAGRNKEAVLAWIPEFSQATLHHMVRSSLVVQRWAIGIENDKKNRSDIVKAARAMADGARSFESKMRAREAIAQEIFDFSDPSDLANILMQMPDSMYQKRGEFLNGLRLLPLGRRMQNGSDKMGDIIDSWMGPGGPYASLNPRTWVSLRRNFEV